MNTETDRARYGGLKEPSERFGGYGGRVPPVPIPNTEVKPASADGTWAEGPRESRSLPNIIRLGPSTVQAVGGSSRVRIAAFG